MDWYAVISRHYTAGRYTNADVYKFVIAGKITEEQYAEITQGSA